MRLRIACTLVFAFAMSASALSASALGQVSETEARELGMEVAWRSQVQLPRVGTGLVSSHLWTEPTSPRRYAVVQLTDRKIRVSADTLDKHGKPIGMDEAKKRATEQAARLLGRTDGFQVVEVIVPRIKLVLVTRDGLVQALDAESGKLIWSTACGDTSAPAHPAAVSPAGVSLIHGERLYLLDWKTGKHRMSAPLKYSSSNALAVCNDIAYVSDFTGRVEAYGLGVSKKPWSYIIQGRAVGRPVSLADQSFCAIASEDGFVYVFAGGEEPRVWLRYESSTPIVGSLASGNGAFYSGNAGGLLTKISVEDRLGRIRWEFRTGRTIAAPPLVAGKQLIVATETGDVFSVDDETGLSQWVTSGLAVRQALAKAGSHVFCRSDSGEIIALDAETGRLRGRTGVLNLNGPVINQLNDRLYLIGAAGRVECLRPIGGGLPEMVVAVAPSVEESDASTTTTEPQTTQPEMNEAVNPFDFGTGAGAGGAADSGDNPFEGTDFFGGEAGGKPGSTTGGDADNPFGNPFGDN